MWLRTAVVHAFVAGVVMMSPAALAQGAQGALLRQAAQIALMHAMGTIACATFMKLGASSAARVPAFFVVGTIFYSGPVYLSWLVGASIDFVRPVGAGCLAFGWLSLLLATSEVDREGRQRQRSPVIPNEGPTR